MTSLPKDPKPQFDVTRKADTGRYIKKSAGASFKSVVTEMKEIIKKNREIIEKYSS